MTPREAAAETSVNHTTSKRWILRQARLLSPLGAANTASLRISRNALSPLEEIRRLKLRTEAGKRGGMMLSKGQTAAALIHSMEVLDSPR